MGEDRFSKGRWKSGGSQKQQRLTSEELLRMVPPGHLEEYVGRGTGRDNASASLTLRAKTRFSPSESSEFSAGERTKITKDRWSRREPSKHTHTRPEESRGPKMKT